MAVYRGPRERIERKFNDPIFGQGKSLKRKNYAPGQHGRLRRKRSTYALQLLEKQKAKYTYGLLERQFSNIFQKAVRKKGVTGELLLQLLEARLDNIVYRLGLAPTRRASRQLVSHKHITVNDKAVTIPSYTLKQGDLVGVSGKSQSLQMIKESMATRRMNHEWLAWDASKSQGKLVVLPSSEEMP